VRRGLASSREAARSFVLDGAVLVSGVVAEKPARLVDPAEPIVVAGPGPRFVGRGGEKLDAALDHFGIDVRGRRALDVGASTGGFTDCLLQRGAAGVVAVDVGRSQLHERLRDDRRVTSRERTDIRDLSADDAGGRFDLVVADVSFISLRSVAAPVLERLAAPVADVVVLVKPQFEAGRQIVAKGRGVVRDPGVWTQVLTDVGSALVSHGAAMMGIMVSPLTGADGNVEFLAHLKTGAAETATSSLSDMAAGAVAGAVALHGGAGRR
jgi:23S rRNA (cytidine1920-2'-O)/16S rRNA (cytidine1409-2'-O)-methyltransferase